MGINPGLINMWADDKKELCLKELRTIQGIAGVGRDHPAVKMIEDVLEDFYRDAKDAERKQWRGR